MLAPVNLLLFLALVLPWFVALVLEHPEFLHYGLVEETMRRYLTTTFRRSEPVYYYGPILLLVFYPWSVLLPEAVVAAWRNRARWTRTDRFFIVWAVVVVVFFSSSQSKRPGYILPGIVALAVLTARLFDHALTSPDEPGRPPDPPRQRSGLALLSAVAAGALSVNLGGPDRLADPARLREQRVPPAAARRRHSRRVPPGHGGRGLRGPVPARRPAGPRRCSSLPAVLFLSVGFGTAARYAEASSSRALARAISPLPPGTIVACLECFAVGLPFYVGQPVTYITQRGRGGLTSNYVRYRLKRDANWPAVLVRLDDRTRWLASQTVPVYVLTKDHARPLLDDIAGPAVSPWCELRPGWWGALVPPPARP